VITEIPSSRDPEYVNGPSRRLPDAWYDIDELMLMADPINGVVVGWNSTAAVGALIFLLWSWSSLDDPSFKSAVLGEKDSYVQLHADLLVFNRKENLVIVVRVFTFNFHRSRNQIGSSWCANLGSLRHRSGRLQERRLYGFILSQVSFTDFNQTNDIQNGLSA
jgi:hypothetical protein